MRCFSSLKRRADFARLRRKGRRISCANLTLFAEAGFPADDRSLAGVSISKPVGTAVVRNRLRRRIQAVLHERLPGLRIRLLVVPRVEAAKLAFPALRAELVAGVSRCVH